MSSCQTDVVVVGSGVAGLAAAAEAAERGASVAVLESEQTIGGASVMSGAACCLVGTPEQRAAGIEDSVDLALRDWREFGGPTADLEWARKYLVHSRRDVRDWCEDLGISWGAPLLHEGNSVPRWHPPFEHGRGIVDAIVTRAAANGVSIITGAEVIELLVEGDRIAGARIGGQAEIDAVHAGATIMATGGFVNNFDMVRNADPRLDAAPRFLLGGAPSARGVGHQVLADAGAAFSAMQNVWVYPNGTPDPTDASGRRGLGIRGLTTELWFAMDGHRFHNESLKGGKSGADALLAQREQSCWLVFDEAEMDSLLLIDNEYFATPAGGHPRAMAEFWATSEFAVRASDVTDLAARTAMPVDALRKGIDAFNSAVRTGARIDPATGRTLAGLHEVGVNGFAALRMFPTAQKNLGGVRTDLKCRVLSPSGRVIPGLYAAGEVAGMAGGSINGAAGLEGTMFGPSLYSGRVAGRSVDISWIAHL